MNDYQKLANLIFPEITETIEDLEKRYPARDLPAGAKVTRFAPSPTGFLHTGSLFASMISRKMAKDSGGVFYTRLEDTDTKREVAGSGDSLIEQLNKFGVTPDEGYLGTNKEKGNYGPYVQSQRADIYKVVIEEGFIYPSVNQNNTYIQKESQTFISSRYNKPSFHEIYSEWEVVKNFTSTENIPISICSGNLKDNYLAHIRDEAGHDQPDDSDKGCCILILFFDMYEYNPEIRTQSNITISNLYLNKYNFLDKIKCVPNGGTLDDAITMREVTQGKDEYFYNKYPQYKNLY